MDSSNVVAIVSVIVTGVASPMLALLTVRWQAARNALDASTLDRRAALDELASELVKFMRINGTFVANFRHGPEDVATIQEHIQARNAAQDKLLAAYGRVSVRFGSQSDVIRAYALMDDAIQHFNRITYNPFLRGEGKSISDDEFTAAFAEIKAAKFAFLDAAHKALQDPGKQPLQVTQ